MLAKGMLACVLREGVCPCIQQQKLLNAASTANHYTCVLLLFAGHRIFIEGARERERERERERPLRAARMTSALFFSQSLPTS